ncbi:hypothetical protein [Actibacterium sp. MT2.3-13A]|uniref:hypothetical protein n=1 Tax=Actibacterium sp. MT2.3-13A TaxID=2828332 RepID=UPI001BA70963|nr:hypothetical protein [Actibacterium sp. MT2.3-13A]
MTPELRSSILLGRVTHYTEIMRTTIFTYAALAAIIEFGPAGYSVPLTVLVVATAAYGILAGGAALDDLINLREDLDDAVAQTAYGRGLKARNLPALKMISAVLLGLVGLAELYAILT